MNEIDKEIIAIIKDLFRSKRNSLVDPDDLLRETIVKWSIYFAVLVSIMAFTGKLLSPEFPSEASNFASVLVAIAFTFLFIHINNKSKNPSLIMFGLTWLSLMSSLYVANL